MDCTFEDGLILSIINCRNILRIGDFHLRNNDLPYQEFNIAERHRKNPGFNPVSLENDIAILTLDSDINFNGS